MCEPITLGVAATAATSTAAATAATAGLFGVGGTFSMMTTLGTLATAASIGSGVMGFMSATKGAQAQQDQTAYLAGVQKNNQIIAERNAKRIEQQGTREANRYRSRVKDLIADQTVSLQGGGDVSVGSTVDLLADTAELGEMDAQTIEHNSKEAGYNERLKGINAGNQSNLYQAQSDSYSPSYAGVSSLMSSVGTVSHKWAMRKSYG